MLAIAERQAGVFAAVTSDRVASAIACCVTNGLFMRNSACCGVVVWNRCGLCVSGLATSNARMVPGKLVRSISP